MREFHADDSSTEGRHEFNSRLSEPLIRGVNFRVWDVAATDIEYQYKDGHTLSLYLKGGHQTYRYDKPHLKGQEGKICLMPQDHLSRWHSPNPIRIAHLYIPDQLIRQEAERHLDIDSRLANLKDVVYHDDPRLNQAMLGLISALDNNQKVDPLIAEQALYAVSAQLLEYYRQDGQTNTKLPNGLSPAHRHLIKAYIKSHLEQKITLESLAEKLHLSPFYFARMFKQSFGDSPANYIIRQRIELAKSLLTGPSPLSTIALECGFSHQSHFNNYFKKQVGVTPAGYRLLVKG